MKREYNSLFFVSMIFLMFISNTSILTDSTISSVTTIIDDFSGFEKNSDSSVITSTQSPTSVKMIHNTTATTWESYFCEINDSTGYQDFSVEVSLHYDYTGSMLKQGTVSVGSYYYENGSFGGPNDLGVKTLGGASIWDAWYGSDGTYSIYAKPNHVKDQYEAGHGSLATSGELTYNFTRIGSVFNITIMKEGITVQTQEWSDGLTRPLNFILLKMNVDSLYCLSTNITFTSIAVDTKSETILNNFSDFEIFSDSKKTSSYLTPSNISMIYDSTALPSIWETYICEVSESEGYENFNVEVTIEYNYTGSILNQGTVSLGSYYYENGTFGGPNDLGAKTIGAAGIWDAWTSFGGKYYVNARPNHVKDQYESTYGSLPTSDEVTFNFSKIGETFTIEIIKSGVIALSHQWSIGLTRPLNFVYLSMNIDLDYTAYTNVNYKSIKAVTFDYEEVTPTPTPTTSPTNTTSLPPSLTFGISFGAGIIVIGLTISVIILSKRIKKK